MEWPFISMVHAPVRVILEETMVKGRKAVQNTKMKEKERKTLLHLMVVQMAKKKKPE